MTEPLVQLAAIAVFGMGAQWLAWRLRLPSILLLLLSGFLLGPVFGVIDPDHLFGETLFPLVSMAVGLILFEGGLTLKIKELPANGRVIFRLISIGSIATWVIAASGARYILGFEWPIAVLAGAILIVTGPTVVSPLLRQIRPQGRAGTILKWEGILIDPVGAVLAVLVFEVIRLGGVDSVPSYLLLGIVQSLLVGIVFGLAGAGLLVALLKRYLIPDHLQNGVTLLMIVGLFVLSDQLAPEGGLLTVTIMGIAMANQPWVPIRHILEFKENLQVLLIGFLFILLAGRVDLANLSALGWNAGLFIVLLIVVARPLGVILSTLGSSLSWNERLFLTWMAPRGIVAAAIVSIFSFELEELGYAESGALSATVLLVIVGTVAFYGLTAGLAARRLGLAEQDPQGVLIVGAHPLARAFAKELGRFNIRSLLLDNNFSQVSESRLDGVDAYYGNALSEETLSELDLGGIGRMLALTSNDDINALAVLHFPDIFGRSQVYQLPSSRRDGHAAPPHLRGRSLFGPEMTYENLDSLVKAGSVVKSTPLSSSFTYADYLEHYDNRAVPLGLITSDSKLILFTDDIRPSPKAGQTIISLIPPDVTNGQG
ncbi:MAG: sodium:proton antiporter [Anaerolineales bacterium]|uniref:cation:proton antiporter n=1 Tax=Promineifilum sp. TaxID=2664178 RepID=UPI001E104ACC|nr:sodium:proton antiporter [Anaerolineales bacterium]MCB8935026.1 sodium:proton antiporter [Promineifilum sp.]MCO5181812.1 cation:proton antiporter [Promineifilum sp.]